MKIAFLGNFTIDLVAKEFKKDFMSQDRVRFYGAVVDVIVTRLGKDHALAKHLQEVFNKYKAFLKSIYN